MCTATRVLIQTLRHIEMKKRVGVRGPRKVHLYAEIEVR